MGKELECLLPDGTLISLQRLADLLKSKKPEDLQEANRLIKNMVKEVCRHHHNKMFMLIHPEYWWLLLAHLSQFSSQSVCLY